MGAAGDVLTLMVGDESNESRKELQKAWRVGILFMGQGGHSSHQLIKRDPPGMEGTASLTAGNRRQGTLGSRGGCLRGRPTSA